MENKIVVNFLKSEMSENYPSKIELEWVRIAPKLLFSFRWTCRVQKAGKASHLGLFFIELTHLRTIKKKSD